MPDTSNDILTESAPDIRIVRMNTDKTRKASGSDTMYEVYFELSASPVPAWRDIFGPKWKELNPTYEAGIDGNFLFVRCPLQEIAGTQLPLLERAVTATDEMYRVFAQEQVIAEGNRVDAWKQERKGVDEIAESLHFE